MLMNNVLIGLKISLPTLMCLMFVLFGSSIYSLTPFYQIPMPFVLSVIFYFSVFHPAILNVFCIFCIGIFADLIETSPFGLNTFFYVLIFFCGNIHRRFFLNLKFNDFWLSYALVLAGVLLLWYIFCIIATLTIMPFLPVLFQYAVLVFTYPAIAWLCGYLNLKIGGL